jgi:hypothetical protein
MALFKFATTDERPGTERPGRKAEITEARQEVLAAFQLSIKEGEGKDSSFLGKPITVTVPDMDTVNQLRKDVQWAAKEEDMGSRFRFSELQKGGLKVVFWAVPLVQRTYVECPWCNKDVQLTESNTLRVHGPRDERCEGSEQEVRIK